MRKEKDRQKSKATLVWAALGLALAFSFGYFAASSRRGADRRSSPAAQARLPDAEDAGAETDQAHVAVTPLPTGMAGVFGRVLSDREEQDVEVTIAGSGIWPARPLEVDAEGRFAFLEVPPGIYEIRARSRSGVSEPRTGLSVEAGQRVFLTFHLSPGANVSGRVLDVETRRGIEHAQVVLTEGAVAVTPRVTHTDSEGRFRFTGVSASSISLSVEAEGFVPRTAIDSSVSDSHEVLLERAATLSGRVLDGRGRPIAGAALEVWVQADVSPVEPGPANLSAYGAAGPGALEVTSDVPPLPMSPDSSSALSPLLPGLSSQQQTNADGVFEIADVAPGWVQLVVRSRGHATASSDRIWVASGQRREVEIRLQPAGSIEGVVYDERSHPIAGAWIEHRSSADPLPDAVVSDDRGRYRIENVSGAITLRTTAEGLPPVQSRADVRPGERVHLDVLLPGAPPRLEGHVVGPGGEPVVAAEVRAESLAEGQSAPAVAVTDESGAFAFSSAVRPPLLLSAHHLEYAESPALELDRVDPRAPLRLELRRGLTVSGSVTARSELDLSRVRVSLSNVEVGTRPRDLPLASDGTFSFDRLLPGAYRIEVSGPGVVAYRGRTTLAMNSRQHVELDPIVLDRSRALSGEVVDALGRVVRHARVSVGGDTVSSDDDGRFSFTAISTARLRLRAEHPEQGTATVDLPEGTFDRQVVLRLSGPGAEVREGFTFGVPLTLEDDLPRVASAGPSALSRGVQVGDVIVSIDGLEVESSEAARQALQGARGVDAVLELERDGNRHRLRVPRERY